MASIFKQQYTETNKNGEKITKKSKCWYIDYKNSDNSRKRVKGFKDKQATLQLAAKLERQAELEQAGVIDKFKKFRDIPLEKHLDDFKQSLMNNGNTSKHAEMTYQRASTIINSCKFAFVNDVQPSIIINEISKLYRERKKTFKDENGKKQVEIERLPLGNV